MGWTRFVATPLVVNPLDESAGAEFLLHRAGLLGMGQVLEDAAAPEREAARQISRLVGGLFLALDQAGAYISAEQCRVQDYLTLYRQEQRVRARLLGRRSKGGGGHLEAVATTCALALRRVEQTSQAAADLLRACAFLDPDLIGEDFLRRTAPCWSAELRRVANDTSEWNKMLEELVKYALVGWNRELQALFLQRIVQKVFKDTLDTSTANQWAERTVQAVDRDFPDGSNSANWDTCRYLFPHAQRCVELIAQEKLSSQDATHLLLNIANYRRELRWDEEARELYQWVLRIREQELGLEHPQLVSPLNELAILYKKQGRYREAEELYQRVLRIREQELGLEHPRVVYPLNNLIILYKEQGKYREAEPLYLRALHICELHLGPEQRLTREVRENYVHLLRIMKREGEAKKLEGGL